MRRVPLAVCLGLLVLIDAPARSGADNLQEAVPLPPLQSEPEGGLQPKSGGVVIANGRVTIVLSVNVSPAPSELTLNGPLFGWTGAPAPYSERQFPELSLRIDGKPATLEERVQSFMGKTDITNLLKSAQLDPWAVTHTPPVISIAPQTPPQVITGFKHLGAIQRSGDDYLAKWTSRRMLSVPLQAASQIQLELSYLARPARARLTAGELDAARQRAYCVSPQQLERAVNAAATSATLAIEEFIIPLAIDGRPPDAVTLTVSEDALAKSSPPAHFFFCAPHGVPVEKRAAVGKLRADVDTAGNLRLLEATASLPAAR